LLDLTEINTFYALFSPATVNNFFAEHVWEHLTYDEGVKAFTNCFAFLKSGLRFSIKACVPSSNSGVAKQLPNPAISAWYPSTPVAKPAFTANIPYLGYCICGTGSSFCHPQISTPYSFAGTLCCGSGFASQTNLMLPMYHSCARFNGTAVNGLVYGISGGFTETCMNHHCKCGYMKHPPIYGFESSSQCCFQIDGNTTCGGNRCAAASGSFGSVTPSMQIPGAGGFAMQTAGGCVSVCGDAGRMGMVCVSYK
jgi:hypothetical protein